MWSPQGTYLTTFHVPGIALWGGERFEKQGRFPHKDVKVCICFKRKYSTARNSCVKEAHLLRVECCPPTIDSIACLLVVCSHAVT